MRVVPRPNESRVSQPVQFAVFARHRQTHLFRALLNRHGRYDKRIQFRYTVLRVAFNYSFDYRSSFAHDAFV